MATTKTLDVRVIEPRFKHPTIFNTFDDLAAAESFIIINDHDPKPLYYQLLAERPGQFTWEYLENGPEEWKVEIGKPLEKTKEPTIGKIAARDYRKAMVFRKYGIDFCCGGKKTLTEAAKEKGINPSVIEEELKALDNAGEPVNNDFNSWNPEQLINYINENHHQYIKTRVPEIIPILYKVLNVHSDHHPHLVDLYQNFTWMAEELADHLNKEEALIFPSILSLFNLNGDKPENNLVSRSVTALEDEHSAVGQYLENIRKITDNFIPPAGACGSFRLLYSLLSEFEEDMHKHVHLENNILFPKAIELEKSLNG
jgi:regulator of cell morphogenesis and NO signaling